MKEGESHSASAFESGDRLDSRDPHAKETSNTLAGILREVREDTKPPEKVGTLHEEDLGLSDYEYRLQADRIAIKDKAATKERRKARKKARVAAKKAEKKGDAPPETADVIPEESTEELGGRVIEPEVAQALHASALGDESPEVTPDVLGERREWNPRAFHPVLFGSEVIEAPDTKKGWNDLSLSEREGIIEKRKGRSRKTWAEMSEEERRETYGTSYEQRKLVYELQKSRTVLALTERQILALSNGEIKRGGVQMRIESGESVPKESDEEKAYAKAFIEYEKKRAEYIGERGLRYVKERVRMADAKAEHFYEGKWGRFRKGWSTLSNKWSLEGRREARGEASTNWLKRMGRRMVSVRTGIGVGLLGAAHLIPGVGGIAFGVRSAMAGIGSTMTSYELMRKYSDEKELRSISFTPEEIEGLSTIEVESALDKYEAQAYFSGKRFPENKSYALLIAEYKKRAKEDPEVVSKIKELDRNIYRQELRLSREEAMRQAKALVLGIFGAVGIRWTAPLVQEHGRELVSKIASGIKHGISSLEQSDPSGVIESFGGSKILEKSFIHIPLVTPEEIDAHVEAAAKVPDKVLDQVVNTPTATVLPQELPARPALFTPETAQNIHAEPINGNSALKKIELFSSNIVENDVEVEPAASGAVEHSVEETIQKGGSVWKAAHSLFEKGLITKEQFNKAWGSDASFYKTEGGKIIRLPNLDQIQPGAIVRFVRASGSVPDHFEIGGNTAHIGDTNDLAHAFRAAHKPLPDWLQQKLGIEEEIEKGVVPKHVPPTVHTPSPEYSYASVERAQEAAEGVSKGEYTIDREPHKFRFGRTDYIRNKNGQLVDVNFRHFGGAGRVHAITERAVRDHFHPDYEQRIERSIPYYYSDPMERHQEFLRRNYQAREAAYELAHMREVLKHPGGRAEKGMLVLDSVEQIVNVLRPMNVLKPTAVQF